MMNVNMFCWMVCFRRFDDIICLFNSNMPMFLPYMLAALDDMR